VRVRTRGRPRRRPRRARSLQASSSPPLSFAHVARDERNARSPLRLFFSPGPVVLLSLSVAVGVAIFATGFRPRRALDDEGAPGAYLAAGRRPHRVLGLASRPQRIPRQHTRTRSSPSPPPPRPLSLSFFRSPPNLQCKLHSTPFKSFPRSLQQIVNSQRCPRSTCTVCFGPHGSLCAIVPKCDSLRSEAEKKKELSVRLASAYSFFILTILFILAEHLCLSLHSCLQSIAKVKQFFVHCHFHFPPSFKVSKAREAREESAFERSGKKKIAFGRRRWRLSQSPERHCRA